MIRPKLHIVPPALSAAFLAAYALSDACAQRLSEAHAPITGSLVLPPTTIPGSTYSASKTVGLCPVCGTFGIDITPTISASGDVLDVSCPGVATLQFGDCGTLDYATLSAGPNGSASMNFALQLGLVGDVSFKGKKVALPFITPQTVQFVASEPVLNYGFTPTVLSSSQSLEVLKINVLPAAPNWLASIQLQVYADITVSQTLSANWIDIGSQQMTYYGQQVGPFPFPTSCDTYPLGIMFGTWSDTIAAKASLTANLTICALRGLFCWTHNVANDDLISESITAPLAPSFQFPSFALPPPYAVTPSVGSGSGSISPANQVSVCLGRCQIFTATPDVDNYVCGWYVNGVSQQNGGTQFTLSGVDADASVVVDFCISPIIGTAVATTGGASDIARMSAKVTGTANANGSEGAGWFRYGLNEAYGSATPLVPLSPDTNDTMVTNLLTGLAPNSLYHYQVVVSNSVSFAYGDDQTFATGPSAPSVFPGAVTGLSATSGLLNGSVSSSGLPATAWFQYGLTTSYSDATPQIIVGFGNNNTHPVAAMLTNLMPASTYHFQLLATNSAGTVLTTDQMFRTLGAAPDVSTGSVSEITGNQAAWSGSVSPNGLDTVVWLQYGTTTNYGQTAPNPALSCGNGFTNLDFVITLADLTASTPYYVQLVASNAAGLTSGPDQVFNTDVQEGPISFEPVVLPAGGLEFSVFGTVGQTYVVQYSTDFDSAGDANWVALADMTLTNPVQSFVDATPAKFARRFYRALPSPPASAGISSSMSIPGPTGFFFQGGFQEFYDGLLTGPPDFLRRVGAHERPW